MSKIKIEFTSNVALPDHTGEIAFSAKAGDLMELEATSAHRWIRRGLAQYAPEPKAPAPKAAKKKAAK